MKKWFLILPFVFLWTSLYSQTVERRVLRIKKKTHQQSDVIYGKVVDGDTILIVNLPEVDISLMQQFLEACGTRRGTRLIHNVRKTYPYAKLAGMKLREYDSLLVLANSDKERKALMKQAEDEILKTYGKELENLTFTQGHILIRLIDRETGNNSYTLVKDLRGKFRAVFYQGFARLWGYNLKTTYDPENDEEDRLIETIILLIDKGVI